MMLRLIHHSPRITSFATTRTFTTVTTGVKTSATGAFQREATTFRNWIDTAPNAKFPPESGRYHLYASFGCPWANRCLAMINLKGLQDSIGVTIVHPVFQRTRPNDPNDSHIGWVFADPKITPTVKGPTGLGTYSSEGAMPDTINNAKTVRELYERCTQDKVRYSVPVLWDKKEQTIVSNESGEIIRMLNNAFPSELDYYPLSLRNEIDAVNAWVYEQINNGVYKCGFATQQDAYDEAVTKLFERLDRAEAILSKQRFLCGTSFTEADLKLFMTLIRFDDVHVGHFKTNKKTIREYTNLSNYVRDIYQHPAIKPTINMKHIITHYYSSQVHVNPTGIIPQGPNINFDVPHNRHRFKAVNWYN